MNTRVRAAFALTAALALGLGACSKRKSTAEYFPDSLVATDVVAIVNGDSISGRDLMVLAYTTTPSSADSLASRSFNLVLLDQMIDRTLFTQEARGVGTILPENEVNKLMAQFDAQLGGAAAVDTTLHKLGLRRADVKNSFRRDLMIRAYVQQALEPTVTISDADARAYFDQNLSKFAGVDSVRARHIVVFIGADDTAEIKAERRKYIEGLRQRILLGMDFAFMATRFSQDGTAPRGGDLGFFARGTMVKEFEDAAFALKKGEMSDIVETAAGYHIIKCEDRRKASPANFEASKPRILAMLKQQALGNELQNRLKRNREAAIILRNYDTGA